MINMKSYVDLLRLYLYDKTGAGKVLPARVNPFRSSIRLTERCNSRCTTCGYWKKEWEDRISTEKAIDVIKQLKDLGVKRLRFTGGEPLLREDLFNILKEIDTLRFEKITLATNGILLDKYYKEINNSCLTDLGVSIDGLAEVNDKIRGIPGGFERVMDSLKLIQGKRITIMSTLSSYLAKDLEGLFALIEEKKLLWDMNLPDNRPYFLKDVDIDDFWPLPAEVDAILEAINRNIGKPFMKRISKSQLDYTEKYLKKEKLEEVPCFLGYTDIDIDSEGRVYSGCYVLPEIGNILDDDLKTTISRGSYNERLRSMLDRNCPGCNCGYELNLIVQNLPSRFLKSILGRGRK